MSESSEVTVENTGETYACSPDTPLLDAALAAGLHMPHNCRGGACGACKAELLDGTVDHGWAMSFAITDEEKAAGYCLCCQSRPTGPRIRLRMVNEMVARQAGEDTIVPAEIPATIIAAHLVTPSVLRLVTALPGDVRFRYGAGMDMEFLLPGIAAPRPYSIATAPDEDGTPPHGQMTFYIARHDKGAASGWLHENARVGEALTVRGPYGDFAFPAAHDGPVVALAGGTGLSPILAAVAAALARGFAHPIQLLFSVRDRREIFALEELTRLVRRHANLGWMVTLTRDPEAPAIWRQGRIPALLAHDKPDLSACAALIAGSPGFVDACSAAVRERGVDPARIVLDSFLSRPTTVSP
jgi:CDP-4-dehydro-6-deoxyglucose reductase, E3